jgi:hypothetical protein
MDQKQNSDLARSLDQIINLLTGILIALWAIFGLLGSNIKHDRTRSIGAGEIFENSYFIAGPAEQESGADWRAVVGVGTLKCSAFRGALFRQSSENPWQPML